MNKHYNHVGTDAKKIGPTYKMPTPSGYKYGGKFGGMQTPQKYLRGQRGLK